MGDKTSGRRRNTAALPTIEIIVRRGALRRFDKLKKNTADLPVKLSWDRRVQEPQPLPGEGQRDYGKKRASPPFTWEVADFVVVERSADKRRRGDR